MTQATLIDDRKTEDNFLRLNLNDIYISRAKNVRDQESGYSEDEIEEMASSIEEAGGLLNPLSIIRIKPNAKQGNKKYALLAGFRRAEGILKLAEEDEEWLNNVPCRLTNVQNQGSGTMLQLMENMQRKNLNPMEIAEGIDVILKDEKSNYSAKDVARFLGMSETAISQHRKLLKFPVEIQKLMTVGNEVKNPDNEEEKVVQRLQFSHARKIQEKRVPESDWPTLAKMALSMDYGDFVRKLDSLYGEAESDDESNQGDTSASTQKTQKLLRATQLTGSYIPFLKQKVEKADGTKKVYTAKDVEQARLDAINTVLQDSTTELNKDIQPFLEKQKKQEEEESKKKDAEKAKEKAFRGWIKQVRDILRAPIDPENPDQKRPDLPAAVGIVSKEVVKLKGDKLKELGFELDRDNFSKDLHEAYVKDLKEKKLAKEKREKEKAEKEKAEAEAKKAEESTDEASEPEAAEST